jgi:NADH dehydrogenase
MTSIPSPKLVTVFGGSGFLGRHIVWALAADGWRIRVAVRKPHLAQFLVPMGRVGQIQIVKTNVRDREQMRAALQGASAAINLVGVLIPSGKQSFDALHMDACDDLAELADEMGLGRLLHISALGASEDGPARYFRTKATGEATTRTHFPPATILRLAAVFGPEDNLFNRFAALARYAPVLPLFGGGQTRFQPVFAGDVAQAVVKLIAMPEAIGKTYELAGPEVMTLKDIMALACRETHRQRLLLPLPMWMGKVMGAVLGLLPNPVLTVREIRMLQVDTVAEGGLPGLRELGIAPTSAEAVVPSYLWRFRKEGQFEPAVV